MRNAILTIIALSILIASCTANKEVVTDISTEPEGRPAPLEIYVNKESGDVPVTIQGINRIHEVLTRMDVELTFFDTLADVECEIEIQLVGPKWAEIGDSRREIMTPNSTDLYNIDLVELNSAECWSAIEAGWENVIINGKITETGFYQPGEDDE